MSFVDYYDYPETGLNYQQTQTDTNWDKMMELPRKEKIQLQYKLSKILNAMLESLRVM